VTRRQMGVDELYFGKQVKFITVVSNLTVLSSGPRTAVLSTTNFTFYTMPIRPSMKCAGWGSKGRELFSPY